MTKRPYFARLMVYGVCISLIPLLMLGYSLSGKASNSIQNKVDEANAHILYQKQQRVEQVLRNADRLAAQLITSELMQDALPQRLEPIDFRQIEDLKQAIGHMASLESAIRDVYLINAEQLWSISNAGWNRYGSADQMGPMLRYGGSVRSGGWVVPEAGEDTFGKNRALLVKHLPVNAPDPRGLLVVSLSLEQLGRLLEEPGGGGEGAAMVTDETGRAFAGELTYASQVQDIEKWISRSDAYESERGTFHAAGGGRMTAQRQLSSLNGWRYLSVVSAQDVTREARSIFWFAALLVPAVAALAAGLSFAVSRRLYRPIRQMTTLLLGEGRAFSLSRKSDEVSFLYDRLRIQTKELKSFYVNSLLQGHASPGRVSSDLAAHGYRPAEWTMLQTVAIGIDSLAGTRFQEKDRDLLLFAINNVVGDIAAAEDCLVPVVPGPVQATVWIGREDEERFRTRVETGLGAIHRAIEDVLGISASLGVSRIFRDSEDIPHSYREAIEALKYRPSLGGGAILYIHDVETVESRRSHYPAAEVEALINAVKTLEPAHRVRMRLDDVLSRIYQKPNGVKEQRFYTGRLIFDWIGFLHKIDADLPPRPDDAGDLLEAVEGMCSLEEIRSGLLDSLIEPALETLSLRRERQYDTILRVVVESVEREYNSNITLEACADRLHYHPDYVGRVFKKRMGVGFSEYLSDYRLAQAKQLLTDSGMKIADIAQQVGYANSQNFIRHFRKSEGMTPGEYREQHS